jgi:hypothetical protein
MAKANITVGPNGRGGWAVKHEGSSRPISNHRKQETAIEHGRPIAKGDRVEFIIRGRDGRIREKDSYGHDPRNIPG